ncbi:MAG: SLATT domain-containing protein [Planctomycetota bacterium]|jgi:hypothetical protein
MNTDVKGLLDTWQKQISTFEMGHYKSATSCRVFNYSLGIPLVLITTFVATDFFANLEILKGFSSPKKIDDMKNPIFMIVSFFTIAAPILASLQSFLKFPERATLHKQAAVEFGKLRKEIEKTIVFPPKSEEGLMKKIDEIQLGEAHISSEAPSIGKISFISASWRTKV